MTVSRRDFLRGGALLSAVMLARQAHVAQASSTDDEDQPWGILVDLTRCTGCNSCALACKAANQLPHPTTLPQSLSAEAYTYVAAINLGGNGESLPQYAKRQCMHCLEPACVSACTVGALQKTPEGPVVYNASKCIGCRYCQYACPFGVPTYDWNNALGLIHKCQMCANRLADGQQQPACVGACTSGALRFGTRKALLAQAHAQISSNPDKYIDHIYGEHEVGGTSVLYLSGLPFAALGFPELPEQPVPHYAEAVMRQTPVIALAMASLATTLYWITKRRQQQLAIAVTEAGNDH